ncbi:MAG: Gldg family protein [Gemmatales bacterium]
MEKPVHAYVILEDGYLLSDVQNTLNSAKKLTPLLEVTEIPLLQKNVKEIDALLKKYDVLRDATGLALGILLVQDPNSDKPLSTFIKQDDLEESSPGIPGQSAGRRFFKGEAAIYTALRDFRQEKKKVTVYFTQDSGELSIDEAAARGQRNTQVSRTILNLKRRLEKAGYTVKPLSLGEQTLNSKDAAKVPDDALAVIVADPLRMTPEKAAVLDAYLKRPKAEGVEPGKLLAFFDPHFAPDGKVLPTGLESVLGTYGVQVGQDVIYSILSRDTNRDPTNILVIPIPQLGIDPDIQDSMEALISNSTNRVELHEARSVKPIPAVAGFDVKGMLYAYTNMSVPSPNGPRRAIWLETINRPKPIEYIQGLMKTEEILKIDFLQAPPSVAVTVRNRGAQQPPQNPMAQPPPAKLGEPRMVVFGDATFLTDTEAQATADLGSNMVLTTLAWVRGKPELDSGDVQPKERKAYRLNIDSDTFTRLVWLPPVWLLVTVILAGVGVAILRRQ